MARDRQFAVCFQACVGVRSRHAAVLANVEAAVAWHEDGAFGKSCSRAGQHLSISAVHGQAGCAPGCLRTPVSCLSLDIDQPPNW